MSNLLNLSTFTQLAHEHLRPAVGPSLIISIDAWRATITVPNWWHDAEKTWEMLRQPLAQMLSTLEQSGYHPAMSYRNYHVLTAVLVLTPDDGLLIVIGGNRTLYSGAQRHCAEWSAAMYLWPRGLRPIAAITGAPPQADDTTGIVFAHNVRVTCDDCRWELVEHFGWPPETFMTFFHLREPGTAVHTTFLEVLERHQTADKAHGRKADQRVHAFVR